MSDPDDPFIPPGSTVMRPQPGKGRRGPSDVPRVPAADPATSAVHEDPAAAAVRDVIGTGLNPLVRAATPLLLLAGQVRGVLSAPDLGALRRQAHDEVRRFTERAGAARVQTEVAKAARYALCATLDEAVMSTPWGSQSDWGRQTLLLEFHGDMGGGETVFEMLDRLLQQPDRSLDLLELLYLCLAVGFAGKYHASARGDAELAKIRHATFRCIRDNRGVPKPELSLRWRGLQDRRNPVIRYVPWWVVGAAALALVAITFTVLTAWLRGDVTPVQIALSNIGSVETVLAAPAKPIVGPTVKQLLAGDEARGAVDIEERGAQTRVTPQTAALFASGSATVSQEYEALLRRIAVAMNQVPGRIEVIGHTDDQPLRSARFADNFDLSRERALSVAKILQQSVTIRGRIESKGVGSSQPKYQERARNRRVEILHTYEN